MGNELTAIESEPAQTDCRPGRRRDGMRLAALVALCASACAILIYAGNRPANAQDYGGPFQRLLQRIVALEDLTKTQATEISALRAALLTEAAARDSADAALEDRAAALEDRTQYIEVSDGEMYIANTNLHVVNGLGTTDTANGKGNLIVGYNEPRAEGNDRSGSHTVVVGMWQNYSSYGGLIGGEYNALQAPFASVVGGATNTASAECATVCGGERNVANGLGASVAGGQNNVASGLGAAVTGGVNNTASGWVACIAGGYGNTASGGGSAVSGGWYNTAYGFLSTVGGGGGGIQAPNYAWAAGAGNPTTYTGNFRSQ